LTLENLKQNIEREKEIIREITVLYNQIVNVQDKERTVIIKTVDSLVNMLRILNNSVPALVENISPVKKLGEVESIKGLVKMKYEDKYVTVNERDRKKFIDELSLTSFTIKKIKKDLSGKEIIFSDFKKPSFYAKISNRFFSKISNNLITKGNFKDLNTSLRKANMPFLLNTYVSMIFFTTLLSAVFSVILFIVLLFYKIEINSPFFFAAELTLSRLTTNIFICIIIPIATFLFAYLYPTLERQGINKKINHELPFAVIHMAAIARSGVEPSQIFKVIALSKEYPYTRQEIKKVINQVNVYGYDLVNSLKNSAKTSPSTNMSDLFNGLATTISEGGNLPDFLDKRSETLLFDYRLDREKSTKMAETFMDLYISIVIAAPMILMVLLVVMSVSKISIGLSLTGITVIIVSIVSLINIVFLAFLHIKQTGY